MDVLERINELMKERGWSVYKLAKESGIPETTVRNYFRRNSAPTVYTLEQICTGLGITLAQFFDVEGNLGLTAEQQGLVNRFDSVTPEQKKMISDMLNIMIHSNLAPGEKDED
ncbi:MAG: helix-turn-helix transcriptional regulator [Clostridia bacterium]|nr:helix-turn-helix transcriptional regulator [Clostridia bacterium]